MKNIILTLTVAFGMLFTTIFAADAGLEQQVYSNDLVQLDATNSIPNKDGEIVKYKWKQIKRKGTLKVDLSDKKSAIPTFIAPVVEEMTELVFRLKTKEYYSCKDKGSSDQQKCKKYTTKDTVSIFVLPESDNNTENNDSNLSGLNIDGKIIDINGVGIDGATVTIGMQSVTTDTNGSYSIINVEVDPRVSIDVTHPNYLSNSRIVEVLDHNITLDIELGEAKATLTFSSAQGGNVSHDGASVVLPANGYVDSNGTAYTGEVTVKMSYYPITTLSGRAAFPGTFEGIDENGTFPIQSYGFMNVELTDPQGNTLNLAQGNTATLTYPIDNSLSSPATIPLWFYDIVLGYWVQEGEAVRINSSYVGTVSHFTSWNLDAKGPVAQLTGCVEDVNGLPMSDADVQFRSLNWDSIIVKTDENGSISVYNILAEAELTFTAVAKIGDAFYYGEYPTSINLSEGEDRILPDCVVVTEQTNLPGTVTVTGTLTLYNFDTGTYEPWGNQRVSIFSGLDTYIITGASNNDGTFSITFSTVDTIQYSVGTYYPSKSFTIQSNKGTYDVGILETRGNVF